MSAFKTLNAHVLHGVRKRYVYVGKVPFPRPCFRPRSAALLPRRALLNQQKVEQPAKMAFPVEVGVQTKFQQCRVYF